MPGEDWHPDAGPRDEQVGQAKDLAALIAELLLLVGLQRSIVDDAPSDWDDVEGDRTNVLARVRQRDSRAIVGKRRNVLGDRRAHLVLKFADAR